MNATNCGPTLCANATVVKNNVSFEPPISQWQGTLIFILNLVIATCLSKLFLWTRRVAFRDQYIQESAADAGGSMNGGMIAAAMLIIWSWSTTLTVSSFVTQQTGVAGTLWFTAGCAIPPISFSILTVQLRTKAPGAKTYLQLIHVRFGKATHIVFAVFCLASSLASMAINIEILAASTVYLVQKYSLVYAFGVAGIITGLLSLYGGLGGLIYFCYAISLLIYAISLLYCVRVFGFLIPYNNNPANSSIYLTLKSLQGMESNLDKSYLTFYSYEAFITGIISAVGNLGALYSNQGYWQLAVACKPTQVVYSQLIGGIVWIAIPMAFGTSAGRAYLALGAQQGFPLLKDEDASAGLVPAAVGQKLLGLNGSIVIFAGVVLLSLCALVAEVLAVTSVLVIDIFQAYIKPFRVEFGTHICVLCGLPKGRMSSFFEKCECGSRARCGACYVDDSGRNQPRLVVVPDYKCLKHGCYRKYLDDTERLRTHCIVSISIALVPFAVILPAVGIDSGWLFNVMGVFLGSTVCPILLCLLWTRKTTAGALAGVTGGCILGVSVWLGLAAKLDGALSSSVFVANTQDENALLYGNVGAIMGGALFTILFSWSTSPTIDSRGVWNSSYDIDSALTPWSEVYKHEFGIKNTNRLDNRPTYRDVNVLYRSHVNAANYGTAASVLILFLVIPTVMLVFDVFTETVFVNWIWFCFTIAILATIYICTVPWIEEVIRTRSAYNTRTCKKE